jgi:3-deoxy-manno-octulosonate cytidylyltransferase (CMP-KDO synthetase)
MRCAIVIPARMASTRFPGKPLVDLAGKPMIQWVVERAREAAIADAVLVATPDDEILEVCRKMEVEVVKTRLDHPSGTDRLAEVAQTLEAEVFVNVQGDEPLIRPETIRACAEPLLRDPQVQVGSVWTPLPDDEIENPAVVKVVLNLAGDALYFSRFPIPLSRSGEAVPRKKHVGIYAYRRDVLLRFPTWTVGALEAAESLEQLRFLENAVPIRMPQGEGSELAVDTPEQAEAVRRILEGMDTPGSDVIIR